MGTKMARRDPSTSASPVAANSESRSSGVSDNSGASASYGITVNVDDRKKRI